MYTAKALSRTLKCNFIFCVTKQPFYLYKHTHIYLYIRRTVSTTRFLKAKIRKNGLFLFIRYSRIDKMSL